MDIKVLNLVIFVFTCVHFMTTEGYITYIAVRLPLKGLPAAPGSPWPQPREWTSSDSLLTLEPNSFDITSNFGECDVIQRAIIRYKDIILIDKDGQMDKRFPVLKKLQIKVKNKTCDVWPQLDMDETYVLDVKDTSTLMSNTIWGILRGLETFSQLVFLSSDGKYLINETSIRDAPRFPHRGVMLDTARHYIPVPVLLQNLDAMSYNKFNVFHWHIVDDQSFPYESKVFPELHLKGAFSPKHTYRQEDIKLVSEYARDRGIRVLVEFDTPGHTQSWGLSHRELLTPCYVDGVPGKSKYNFHGEYEIMNPMLNTTFEFLDKLYTEIADVFQDDFLHLGMDESYHWCWKSNPQILEFMTKTLGLSSTDYEGLEQYYIRRTIDIVSRKTSKLVIWQDPLDKGLKVDKNVLIDVWKGRENWTDYMGNVVKQGYKAILSSCWYLNYISYGQDWRKYYTCDPLNFNGTAEEKDRVLGGEACIWAEYIDGTNLLQRLWPRASAVAERLWSNSDLTNTDDASFRLDQQRCRMVRRGIPAEPILNGFCGDYDVGFEEKKTALSSTSSAVSGTANFLLIASLVFAICQ